MNVDLTPQQWLILLGVVGIFAALSLYSIWDAFHRQFKSTGEKMAWVQVSVLVPFLGGLAYLIFGKRRGERIR
ncbi:Phospholipase_D-nuclease N-terminal [Paucidesulfovibrio gracilis DSM 16080]|uniref:Phospholipase_D-nuclease N-terminal n=1 Tax=Paucidesulfovibrio gracilis DSM 16080 TaxID=1121449 RepID=A0A1T4WUC6_9BACT|nr:PLD nuclease N-terminal domain-containing protein [Paucidesulfovibrio gracilis]SKA80970.1 Phospholipase_D-nuclease N-terminal [Paucidesulfovibrio gracilis DSM 16080]